MAASDDSSASAITRLRGGLNDLQSMVARPGWWSAGELPHAVDALLDGLLGIARELDESLALPASGLSTAPDAQVNQPLSGIITNAGTCLRMLDANPPNLDGAPLTCGGMCLQPILKCNGRYSSRWRTLFPGSEQAACPMGQGAGANHAG